MKLEDCGTLGQGQSQRCFEKVDRLVHWTRSHTNHKECLGSYQPIGQYPRSVDFVGRQGIGQITKIPERCGAVETTAVYVPLEEMMKPDHFDNCTTEIFAPFQVVTYYNDRTLDLVMEAVERMSRHLTAAVVSNDVDFQTKVLANIVNGSTYAGRRARTTGAPQNHWFGPAGDPRGAPKAIQLIWSCHRASFMILLYVPDGWKQPKAT